MPQYLAPGVYIEEVATGPTPIAGVGTSTVGAVGMTRRGPTIGRPTLVTNWGQFVRSFGGYLDLPAAFTESSRLPYAVEGFFANGGQRMYVMRVVASDASEASTVTNGVVRTRLVEDSVVAPAAGHNQVKLASLRGVDVESSIVLRMTKNGVTTTSGALTVDAVNRKTGVVTLGADPSATLVYEARYTTVFTDTSDLDVPNAAITRMGSPTDPVPAGSNSLTLTAANKGSWGRDIVIECRPESAGTTRFQALISGANEDNKVRVLATAGFYVGAWVEIDRGAHKTYRQVLSVDGPILTLSGNAIGATDLDPELASPDDYTTISTCEFGMVISVDGLTERYSGLTLAKVAGRFVTDSLAGSSLVVPSALPADTHPFLFPSGTDGLVIRLDTGGSDGTAPPDSVAIRGADGGPGLKTGLRALEEVDDVAILIAPGLTSGPVQDALVEQCERLKDRFAILDPALGPTGKPPVLDDIEGQRSRFDSSYAALYYPRISMLDSLTGGTVVVPPSGHIAGIYARVDDSRGVHKAPANEVIRDTLDLEATVTKGEHDVLNPLNINVIRNFRADRRGLRVYGARCVTDDANFRHISVRRLFIFLEESFDEGLQWVVFEPNDYRLWARVRQSVTIFLTRVWRDGALMGAKPQEAFYVRCDESTMSPDDILNGRLVMEIGVCPVRPAEFVIVRVSQWLGGFSVEEL